MTAMARATQLRIAADACSDLTSRFSGGPADSRSSRPSRTFRGRLRGVLAFVMSMTCVLSAARAADAGGAVNPGAFVGVVTNSAKAPVAHATVTARTLDGRVIRA